MSDLYTQMISRQVEIFTQKQQNKIKTTPVIVVGCGGLGGTIIEQLVRLGFEKLTIIDQDVFDKTNLNRQIRSNTNTIGLSKVETTKQEALKINPDLDIKTIDNTITSDNISDIFKDNKIILDAVDNIYTRVLLSREANKQNMAFVHAAVETTMGQLSIFDKKTPSYEELFKLKSLGNSLEESKEYLLSLSTKKPQVIGTTPSIFGALEVNETVKYILGYDNVVLAPKVLLWDIFDIDSFRITEF